MLPTYDNQAYTYLITIVQVYIFRQKNMFMEKYILNYNQKFFNHFLKLYGDIIIEQGSRLLSLAVQSHFKTNFGY